MFAEYGVLNYWTYLVGAIFIVLVPGPNTLFVLKNSVSSGMKGGYLAACGVFIGDAVLMFLAWAGVATLIKTTPILFNIVRYLGAFYLLYLGSKILYATLKGKNNEAKSDEPQYGAIFKRALILSLTNPKAILFYVSFFVQFIDVNAPHTGISFFILAKWIMPGKDGGGFFMTILLGIVGAVVGGWISTLFGFGKVDGFNFGSFVVAVIGAIVVLFIYRKIKS